MPITFSRSAGSFVLPLVRISVFTWTLTANGAAAASSAYGSSPWKFPVSRFAEITLFDAPDDAKQLFGRHRHTAAVVFEGQDHPLPGGIGEQPVDAVSDPLFKL